MMTTETATKPDHYHVFAGQDLGGSQEYFRGKDDRFTLDEARQLASDMKRADYRWWELSEFDEVEVEFGDRAHDDLISDNTAPGWEGIFIIDCEANCRFAEKFHQWNPHTQWGEPLAFCEKCQRLTHDDECTDDMHVRAAAGRVQGCHADDADLELIGMSRELYDRRLRDREVETVAGRYTADILRDALALRETNDSPF